MIAVYLQKGCDIRTLKRGIQKMRIDKLTSRLQTALADAQSLAVGKDHNFIEPVHLMQALLDQEGSSIKPLLKHAGAEPGRVRQAIAREIENLPEVKGSAGDVSMSNNMGRLFNLADKLAQQRGDLARVQSIPVPVGIS